MSNTEDQNQPPQVELFLKQWVQVIEENREKVLAHVMMIAEEKQMTEDVDVEVDVDKQMTEDVDVNVDVDKQMQIILTNPLIEYLMKITKEDLGLWNEALVISKSILSCFFARSVEVMQIFGVIQEFEAQTAKVMDGWINYHLNREQLKGGLLAQLVQTDLLANSDLFAAFQLQDKKMISGLKSDLSDLLNNYSVLIDVLVAATEHMHDDEEDDFNMYM